MCMSTTVAPLSHTCISALIELLSKIGQILKNCGRENRKLFEHIQHKPTAEFWLVTQWTVAHAGLNTVSTPDQSFCVHPVASSKIWVWICSLEQLGHNYKAYIGMLSHQSDCSSKVNYISCHHITGFQFFFLATKAYATGS